MHRLACLRDDVVFLIYLYQRWLGKIAILFNWFVIFLIKNDFLRLYPIDKSRTNEFGESFDEEVKNKDEWSGGWNQISFKTKYFWNFKRKNSLC